MASEYELILGDEGFSPHFLGSPYGVQHCVRDACLSGMCKDFIYKCVTCGRLFLHSGVCDAETLSERGFALDCYRDTKDPVLMDAAHLSGACSSNCFKPLIKQSVSFNVADAERVIALASSKDFYVSDEWRQLRYHMIRLRGARCECCGATDTQLHVDHIVPRILEPWRALDPDNLQILCVDCNFGKGWRDTTDWRKDRSKYPLVVRLNRIRDRSKRGSE